MESLLASPLNANGYALGSDTASGMCQLMFLKANLTGNDRNVLTGPVDL